MSVLKAQPRQCISNIYIYPYISYQTVYAGSEDLKKTSAPEGSPPDPPSEIQMY